MELAIPVCEDQVSNMFDFGHRVVVVTLNDTEELARAEVALPGQGPARIARLSQLGLDTPICGAISQSLASWTSACGIRLFPYVTGGIDEVIEAFKNGELGSKRFVLPGCWQGAHTGSRRRCRRHSPRS
jgi:predicted Fe-Mo cluster-binding NifX family protein